MGFENREALLQPPVRRAAYSDRMAWLMANMARLAYERFEPPESRLEPIIERLAESTDRERISRLVRDYVDTVNAADAGGTQALQGRLEPAGFELVDTFSGGDTQAFLARRERDRVAVLAFRGTEQDWGDIKTDLDARFYRNRDGSRSHTGFRDAYEWIREDVAERTRTLAEDGYALYLTGHSLGGALAVVATRDLNDDSIAACYTFGSPRVGDKEFGYAIKPPIYRVVNAADAVPRVPPTWLIELLYQLVRLTGIRILARFVANFRGYAHWGDMRYLTACSEEDCSDVQVIPNPHFLWRAIRLVGRVTLDWKAPFRDHAIARYCDKLEAYARRRLD